MPVRSLRSKIFLLVVALLLAVAAFVMLTSQRNVTRTVMNSERHAVSNVMELVLRDAEARWAALLTDKITTVRSGRRQLMQTGTVVAAALNSYADMADRGLMTPGAARGMARAWINHLKLDDRRYAFVYDADEKFHTRVNHESVVVCRVGSAHWAGVAAGAEGDRGARDYLRAHANALTLVECGDVAEPYDIDTPDDLWRLGGA